MAYLTMAWQGGDEQKRPGYFLKFHYSEQDVEFLKAAVPHTDRDWNDNTKTWWVKTGYEKDLELIFTNFKALIFDQARLL